MAVYLGIDWSEKSHAVVFLNQEGGVIAQETIGHTAQGLVRLDQLRQELEVAAAQCVVGIETAHHLLVDWLWGHGYKQVYVIPPTVTKSRQATYRQSGARTDRHDAYLIANLLRTDRHLLHPWQPDDELTQFIRSQVDLRRELVRVRLREQNQLRAVLMRYHPAPLAAFSLDSGVSLAFLQRYPTPAAVAELTWDEFSRFAQEVGYGRQHWTKAFSALTRPVPQPLRSVVSAHQTRMVLLAQRLEQTRASLTQTDATIAGLFAQHPDAPIYRSLPGTGPVLQPALLAKVGDSRARFPKASVLQALAGTCPVTIQSGGRRTVLFRRACDRTFRTIVQQWARLSLSHSPWAAGYYDQARERGLSSSRAYRALGNRWLAILWTLWRTGQPYDESLHLQRVRDRARPRR